MIQFFTKKMRNRKGFTLIELVVVIAILGILAAIAVPRLLGFQDRARQQADNQVAAQVKNAFALLYANNEVTLDDDLTDNVFTTDADEATFTVDATTGTATVANLAGDPLYDGGGTVLTTDDLEDLIEALITDIHLQGTQVIHVTINGAGAVSAILAPTP